MPKHLARTLSYKCYYCLILTHNSNDVLSNGKNRSMNSGCDIKNLSLYFINICMHNNVNRLTYIFNKYVISGCTAIAMYPQGLV